MSFLHRITILLEKQDNETFGFEIQVSLIKFYTLCATLSRFKIYNYKKISMPTPFHALERLHFVRKSFVFATFLTKSSLVADLRPAAEGQLCCGDVHVCV